MGVLIVEKELIKKIERMRGYMHDLIRRKGSLTDPEVILASQMLDDDLNEYSRLLN